MTTLPQPGPTSQPESVEPIDTERLRSDFFYFCEVVLGPNTYEYSEAQREVFEGLCKHWRPTP